MRVRACLSAIVVIFSASAAAAATVPSFSAEARAEVTLRSATLSGTATEAYGALRLGSWDTGGDAYTYCEDATVACAFPGVGNAYLHTNWKTGTTAYRGVGDAIGARVESTGLLIDYGFGGPGREGGGVGSQYHVLAISNTGPDPIDLVFAFTISALAETSLAGPLAGGDATAGAGAEVYAYLVDLSDGSERGVFSRDVRSRAAAGGAAGPFASETGTVSGTFSMTLRPNELAVVEPGVDADGFASATHVAVMPLPAGLPLLAAALGGLALLRRRAG